MICPLMCIATFHTGYGLGTEETDCLKEECAWWLEDVSMCSFKELALELRYTQHRLQDMEAKMPHEEQFRK